MVFLAFSLHDQVDKYSSYVGVAAFFGLAVLSLLYFAQARELKRLRDWAGRAPERARELEDRVAAQAETARRAPAPAARAVGAEAPSPQPLPPARARGASPQPWRSPLGSPSPRRRRSRRNRHRQPDRGKRSPSEGVAPRGRGCPTAAPEPAASAPGRKAQAAAALAEEPPDGDRGWKDEPGRGEVGPPPKSETGRRWSRCEERGGRGPDRDEGGQLSRTATGRPRKGEPSPAPAADVADNGAPASPPGHPVPAVARHRSGRDRR